MCYYNGIKVVQSKHIQLKQMKKLVAEYDFLDKPLSIGFEYGNYPVLKRVVDKEDFDIVEMEWGFLPDKWFGKAIDSRQKATNFRNGYKNEKGSFIPGITTLNAMGEELLLPNKIYREAALERRCLVLSTGFYEWRHFFPTNKRTGEPVKTALKIPHFITLKSREYFYMAGIWKPWTDKQTGETVNTLSVVTTAAPAGHIMEQIHNSKKRMPAILNEDLGYEWMFGKLSEARITEIATMQYPSQDMQAYTIVKVFREAVDPTAPFEYEGLPPLELAG